MKPMKIEHWPTSRPIPYATNPRKISDQAVSAVAGSIKAFGFKSPIIVDSEGVIINGHTRLRAAQSLGLDTVPVIVASDLTPDQVRAYRLADNRVAEFTDWDAELLSLEMEQVEMDMDFAAMDELLGGLADVTADDSVPPSSSKEVNIEDEHLAHRCPRCGFEFEKPMTGPSNET